jgi:hypothetical protein
VLIWQSVDVRIVRLCELGEKAANALVREESMFTFAFIFTKRAICKEAAAMFALAVGYLGNVRQQYGIKNAISWDGRAPKYVAKLRQQRNSTSNLINWNCFKKHRAFQIFDV